MYLHLGNNLAVPFQSVIALFDIDRSTVSKHTRAFLEEAQKNGQVVNISEDLPRSFVLCEENKRRTVYISPISSSTLLKRSETVQPGE